MAELDYGSDLSCGVDLDPLGRVVSGVELMGEALLRRAITRQGTLIGCPLYGLGLLDLLNEETTDAELPILASRMSTEFEKDERVISCKVVATRSADGEGYTFDILAESADGPFEFVLTSDGVTAEMLKVGSA